MNNQNINKWPDQLTITRHAESFYNLLVKRKKEMSEYGEFEKIYDAEWEKVNGNIDRILREEFPSDNLKEAGILALNTIRNEIKKEFGVILSNDNMPITDDAWKKSKSTGLFLKETISLPDIIYLSPQLRAQQTLEGFEEGWPELKQIDRLNENYLREQEMGIRNLFYDWKIYTTFNPLEALSAQVAGDFGHKFAGGQSQHEAQRDAHDLIRIIVERNKRDKDKKVLLITHHLKILAIMGRLERWNTETFEKFNREDRPANCGVTLYEREQEADKIKRTFYNKTSD